MPNIRPSAQAYSNAIMNAREIALELKKAILECGNARVTLQSEMMADNGSKMFGMESGEIEMLEFQIAGVYGMTRHMHTLAQALGRKHNEPMPVNPVYDPEYNYLYTTAVPVKLSAPARR